MMLWPRTRVLYLDLLKKVKVHIDMGNDALTQRNKSDLQHKNVVVSERFDSMYSILLDFDY